MSYSFKYDPKKLIVSTYDTDYYLLDECLFRGSVESVLWQLGDIRATPEFSSYKDIVVDLDICSGYIQLRLVK